MPKKLEMISNTNQFDEFFLDQIPFFAISKMTKNQFLKWRKCLKLPGIQFHEKNFCFI